MNDLLAALQSGSASLWLFVPSAMLLGALHGLEPGHSKTLMAAFIIAIRGTVLQAVLLGVSAAVAHSLIIWVLAAGALTLGDQYRSVTVEGYLMVVSALLMLGLALWMFLRTRRDVRAAAAHAAESAPVAMADVQAEFVAVRPAARPVALAPVALPDVEFTDEHERAHAAQIAQRFTGRPVTTAQIVLFGVTGGLMPCPAAVTVLLVCLQLKRVTLGFTLVAAFSVGLALTMVATGALAAWGVRHAERRFRGFGELARRAPYLSCVLLVVLASYSAWHGWQHLR